MDKKYSIFSLIVLANIFLKSIYSDYTPFSYDEIISVKDALLDFGHIKHEAEWDNNPPFYYYCLWVWHQIIPINEFNTRFLSILFVSFSIGLSYIFCLKYFNLKTALIASILLSISNFVIFYSQEARVYSLIIFLAVVSSMLFFEYISSRKIAHLLILSLVNFLIVYSHYIASIVIVTQYIIIGLYYKNNVKLYFSVQSVIILGLIFLRFTKKQIQHVLGFNKENDFWLKTANTNDLMHAFSTLYYSSFVSILFILSALFFLYSYLSNNETEKRDVKMYCFILGFVSVLFLFALGTIKPVFLPRYLIFCVPFATILVSYQLTKFHFPGVILVCAVIIFLLKDVNLFKNSGVNYKLLADVIHKIKRNQDLVVINTRDNLLLFEYYYDRSGFMKYKNIDSLARTENIYGINEVAQLPQIMSDKNENVFLLQSFHKINNLNNPVREELAKKSTQVYYTEYFNGVELTIFNN